MSYLRKNLVAFCLILFSAVMLFYGCDKNEYKKLKLEVSSTNLEIVLDEDSPENNVFSITATVSGMPKGYDGAVSFSVPVNDFISPVVTNPEVRDEGRSTGLFEAKKQGGPVTITVTTLEGNLTQNITVKVVKPITQISFNTLTIPVVKGVKTDISEFLTFNPEGTNQTDVKLELVSTGDSDKLIQVVTDGQFLTVPTTLDLSEFQLRVRSAVNEEVVTQTLATVKVITVVPVEDIVLMHNNATPDFAEDDLAVEKDSKNEYSLILATNTGTLYTKTVYFNFNNDSNENNNYTVTVKGLTESGAIIEDDGQENRFVEVDKHTTIKNGFNINARGNGNTKIQFVIDRTDFPGYFTQTVTLNISVQAFPTEISVNNGSNETKLDKIQLFANYDETTTFGTPLRIVVSNETGAMTEQKVLATLSSGSENITLYDSNKNIVQWGTELIAGARYYLKHNFETDPANAINLNLVSVTYSQITLNIPIVIETQPINLTTTTPEVNLDITKPELKTPLVIQGLTGTANYKNDLEIVELSNCGIINYEASASQITVWPASSEIGECSLKVVAKNGSSITFTITLYEQLLTNNTSVTIAGTVIAAKDSVGGTIPEINIKNGLNVQVYFNINGKEFSSLNNTGLIYHAVTSNSQVVQTKSNVYQLQTQNMSGKANIQLQIVGFNEFGEQTKAVYFEVAINVSVPLTSLIANQNETVLYDTNSLSASQVAEYGTYTITLSSSPFNASFTWQDVEWICEYNGGQLRATKVEREDKNTIDYTFRTSSYDIITLTTTKSNFKQATVTCQIASSTTSVITFNIVAKVNQEFTNENGLVISSPKSISVRFLVYKAQRVTDFVFENVSSKGTSTQPVFELTYDERDLEYNGSVYTNTANCIKTINFSVYPSNALNKNLGVISSNSVVKATVNNVLKTLTIQLLSKPSSAQTITLTVYAEDDVNNGVIGNHKIIQIRILDGSSERSAFEIKTEEDLKKINSSLSSYYVLASDVALNNEWTPIGLTATTIQQFDGTLSGKYVVYDENDNVVTTSYYSIAGLYISNSTYNYYGLFAYIGQNAKVKDLTINSFSIRANITHDKNVFVGALAGYSEGEITNVSVNDQSGVQSFNGLYYENAQVGETSSGIYITAETNTNVHANYFVGGLVGFVNNSALYVANTEKVNTGGTSILSDLRTNMKTTGLSSEYYNTQVVNSKATVQMNVYVKTNNTSFVGGLVGFNNRAVIIADESNDVSFGSSSAQVITAINANLSPQQTAFNNYSSFGGVVGFNNGIVKNIIAKASIFGVYENSTDYYNIKNVGGVVGYNIGSVERTKSYPLLQGYINVGGVVGKTISAVLSLQGSVGTTDYSFVNGKMGVGDGLFTMSNAVEFNQYFRIVMTQYESVSLTYDEFVDIMTEQYGDETIATNIASSVYGGSIAETYSALKVSTVNMFDAESEVIYVYSIGSRYSVADENNYDYLTINELAIMLAKYKTNNVSENSVEFLQLNDNVKLYNSAIVGFNNVGGLIGEYTGIISPAYHAVTVKDERGVLSYANYSAISYNTVYNYSLKTVEQKTGTVAGTGYYGNILLSNAHYYQVSAENRNFAGGLVGKMTNGALYANQVFASIQGELAGLGGLVGKAEGVTNISNSSFVGVIINRDSAATEEVKPATGGLVGDALDATTTFSHSGVANASTGEESYKFITGILWIYTVNDFGDSSWLAGDHNNIASSYFRAKDLNGDYILTNTDTSDASYEYTKSMGYVGDGNKEFDYTYYYSDGSGVKEYVVDGFTYTTKKVYVDTLSANESSCVDCNPSFNFAGDTINEDDLAEFISDNNAYAAYGSDLNGDGLIDADTGEDYANKTMTEFKSTYLAGTAWYVNEQLNEGLPVILSKNKLEQVGENGYKISLLANFPPTEIVLENKQNLIDTFFANLPDDLSSIIYYYGLDSSNYKSGTNTLNFASTSNADKISTSTSELNAELLKQNTYSLSEIFNLSSIPKFLNGNSFKITSSNSSVLSVEFDKQNNVKFVAKSAGYALVTVTSEYNVALTKTIAVNVANATTALNLGYFASGEQKYIQENQVMVINKSTEEKQITLPISSNFSANHIFNGNSYPEVSETFKLNVNENSGVRYYYAGTRTVTEGSNTNTYSSVYYATNDIEGVIDGIQLSINGLKFSYELVGTIQVDSVLTNYYTIYVDVPYGTTANFVGVSETERDITLIAVPYLIATSTKGETNKVVVANLGDFEDSVILTDSTIMGLSTPAEDSIVLDNTRFGVENYTYSQYQIDYLNNLQNLITKFNVRISKATWNLTKSTDSITFDVKTAPSFEIEIETDKDDEELYIAYYQNLGSESVERKISYTTMFEKFNGEVQIGNITLRANNKNIVSLGNKNYVNFSFTVLVKDENKTNVQDEVSTTFKFFVAKQDSIIDVDSDGYINNAISSLAETNMLTELPVTLLTQTITEITLKHYPNSESKTSTDANGNKITEVNLNEIAYDNIIPGNVGVLKAYISPYYASFDELEVVSSTSSGDVVLFEQLLAHITETSAGVIYGGSYETLITANDQITNGIKLQKISTINQDGKQAYDGNIYIRTLVSSFATEADKFTLTLRAYKNGVLAKEQSITLDVQTPPSLSLTVNGDEAAPIARGTEINFEANLRDINGTIDFSSSYMYRINSNGIEVKVGALNADFAIKNNGGTYSVSVNNNIASDRYIKVIGTVTKEINGETITHTDYITLHVTDFVIEEISVQNVTNGNIVGMFNQPYSLIVKISKATYNSANADVVKEKIKELEADFSAYSDGQETLTTWKLVNTLASSGSSSRYGSLRIGYNGNDSFIIGTRAEESLNNSTVYTLQNTKFGSGDRLAAVIQYVYTDSGIIPLMTDDDRLNYSSSAYFYEKTFEFGFGFYRIRDEERPDPIETAEQFAAMEDGVDYILVNDITLTDWTPLSEDLKINSLDGNGYVITIESFNLDAYTTDAEMVDNVNIGIFSKINAGTTIKNLTIEVKAQQKSNSIEVATYDNTAVDLYVDARAYKNINFGILAGENAGIITNCQIINDAGSLREERELTIAREYFLSDARYIEYKTTDAEGKIVFDEEKFILDNWDSFRKGQTKKYDANGNLYGEITGSDNVRHLSVVRVETTTTIEVQTHYMAGLVGLNLDEGTDALGYITNSSVENITINGVGYVAGFVASNAGKISTSYFKGANIINRVAENYSEAATGGFVVKNSGTNAAIQYSYIQGRLGEGDKNANPQTGASLTNGDKTGLTAENKAGFAGYNYANASENSVSISRLRALNAIITTKTNASAFVYENDAIISNSYANIMVNSSMGTSGFVFTNKATGTISSCYSLSSVKTNSWDASPFTGRSATHEYNNANPDGITDCHYLKLGSDENATVKEIEFAEDYLDDNEPATSLGSSQFGEYNTFQSYAFNTDFELSSADSVTRAVWFIPNDASSSLYNEYFKNDYYVPSRPELVAANLRTISVRVWVGSETSNENSYTYVSTVIGQGLDNPLLVKTAEDFNRYLNYETTNNDTERNFAIRFISDITFNKTDLTAQTYNMEYYGDLDGNGMSINELRLVSDTDFENEKTGETITHLGLFGKIITKNYGEEDAQRGVVRNININVSEVRGSKVTYVGALAGSIENADVFNVTIAGDEVIQGKNLVGGLAGLIKGDSEIVNITSSLSAKAAYFKETNRFSTKYPTELPSVYGTFNLYYSELQGDEVSNVESVSYAGGIAGVFDVSKRSEEEGMNPLSLFNAKARSLQVTGDVTIIAEIVGGIFGLNGQEATASDLSFIVQENTAPQLRGSRIVGGLVGENRGEIERSYIAHESTLQEKIDATYKNSISSNSYKNSDLNYNNLYSSNAHYTGGLVGFNNDGKITNAYAKLNVINMNSMYVGGFAGLSIGGEYSFCYTIATVSGFKSAGGFIGAQSVYPFLVNKTGTGENEVVTYASNTQYANYIFIEGNRENALSVGKGASKLVGVVAANIWRQEDLVTNRTTLYNAEDLKIGTIIGVAVMAKTNAGKYQLSEIVEVGDLTERKKNETIFFIQPKITSLRHSVAYDDVAGTKKYYKLMSEVGAFEDNYGFTINQNYLTRDYRFSTSIDTATNGDTYNESADASVTTIARPQGLSGYAAEPKKNEDNEYIVNGNAGTGADYTAETADKKYYRYSRMQNIGSARTLKEIITTLDIIETDAATWGDSSADDLEGIKDSYDDVVNTPIFNTWNVNRWTGVRKDTVADQNTVFPYLEAKPEKTKILVYKASDLELMSTYVNAEFVLMNDIDLQEDGSNSWTPVGTKAIPFKGVLHSDTNPNDGSRWPYTIYNLSVISAGASYAGLVGYATEAEFKDFNLSTASIAVDGSEDTPLFIGSLVGYASGGTTFENVNIVKDSTLYKTPDNTSFGAKITTSTAGTVGGLVGFSDMGNITNCVLDDVQINVSGIGDLSRLESERPKTLAFGGLAGYLTSADPNQPMVSGVTVNGSLSLGSSGASITMPDNNKCGGTTGFTVDIGGLVGRSNDADSSQARVVNVNSKVTIVANINNNASANISSVNVGGIIGKSSNTLFTESNVVNKDTGETTNIFCNEVNGSSTASITVTDITVKLSGLATTSSTKNSTLNVGGAVGAVYARDADAIATYITQSLSEISVGKTTQLNVNVEIANSAYLTSNIGGAVGYSENATIRHIYANANVQVADANVGSSDNGATIIAGGVIGKVVNGQNISNVASLGNLSITNSQTSELNNNVYAGGAFGEVYLSEVNDTLQSINKAVAQANVSINLGDSKNNGNVVLGGFVGKLFGGNITESASFGNLAILNGGNNKTNYAGGFVGFINMENPQTQQVVLEGETSTSLPNIVLLQNNYSACDMQLTSMFESESSSYAGLFIGNIYYGYDKDLKHLTLKNNYTIGKYVYTANDGANYYDSLYIERNNKGGFLGGFTYSATSGVNSTNVERASNLVFVNNFYNSDFVPYTNSYLTGLTSSEMLYASYTAFANYKTEVTTNINGTEVNVWTVANNSYPRLYWIDQSGNDSINASTGAVNASKLQYSVAGSSVYSVQASGSKVYPETSTIDSSLSKQAYIANANLGNLTGKTLTGKTIYIKNNATLSGTITKLDEHSLITGLYASSGSNVLVTTNNGMLANVSGVKNVVTTNNGVIYRLTFAGTNLASTLVTTNNGGIDTMVAEDTSSSQTAVNLVTTNNGVIYRSMIKNTKVSFASTLGTIKSSYYLSTADSKTVANYFNQMGSAYSYDVYGTNVDFDLAKFEGDILSGEGFDFANDWVVIEPETSALAPARLTLNYGAPILRYELYGVNATRGGYNFDNEIDSNYYWTNTATSFDNLVIKYAGSAIVQIGGENPEIQMAEIAQATSVGEVVSGYPKTEMETTKAGKALYDNGSAFASQTTTLSGSSYTYVEVETTEYVYGVKTTTKRKLLNFENTAIYLTEDVDLGGKLWTPIGFGFDNLQVNVGDVITSINSSSHNVFKGTFNGAGYVITNVTSIESNKNVGLFGTVYAGNGPDIPVFANIVIKNSNFISVSKNGGFALAGALAGRVVLDSANSKQFVLSKVGTEHANVFATNRASGIIGDYLSLSSQDSVSSINSSRFIETTMNYAYVNSDVIVSKGTGNTASGIVNFGNNNIYNPSHQLQKISNYSRNTGLGQIYFAGNIGDYRLNSENNYTFVNQHTDLSTGFDSENQTPVTSLYGIVGNILVNDSSTDKEDVASDDIYAINFYDANIMFESGNITSEYLKNEALPNFDWGSVWTRLDGQNDNYPVLISKVGYWVETIKESSFTAPSLNASTKTYSVSRADQLAWIANKVNTSTSATELSGYTVKLTANIDLSGRIWSTIGYKSATGSRAFAGTFDFNGYKISGMTVSGAYINKSDYAGDVDIEEEFVNVVCITSNTVGLFGYTEGATITSGSGTGTISGLAVGSDANVGSVVGFAKNGSISNITSNVVVRTTKNTTGSNTYAGTGGIVGTIENGLTTTLNNLLNNGEITSSSDAVGGIIGYITDNSSAEVKVTKTRNTANITSTGNYVGGIVGFVDGIIMIDGVGNYVSDITTSSTNKNYLTSSTPDNSGTITGSGDVGGIAGYVRLGNIEAVTNAGDVIATTQNYAGGIVGRINEESNGVSSTANGSGIYEAVNIGNVLGIGDVGGAAGYVNSTGVELVNILNRGFINKYSADSTDAPTSTLETASFGGAIGGVNGLDTFLKTNAYSIIDVSTSNGDNYIFGSIVTWPGDYSGSNNYLLHAIFNMKATVSFALGSKLTTTSVNSVTLQDIFDQNLVWQGVGSDVDKYSIQLKYNNVPGGVSPSVVNNAYLVESQEHMEYLSDLNKKRFGKSSISANQTIKINKAFTISNGDATQLGSSAYTWGNDVDGGNYLITLSVAKDIFGIVKGSDSNDVTFTSVKLKATSNETGGLLMSTGDYVYINKSVISSCSISTSATTFGSFASTLTRSHIVDSSSEAKITATTNSSIIGGLVGTTDNTTITTSSFTGSVLEGSGVVNNYAGGIVATSTSTTYTSCTVGSVEMTSDNSFDYRVGEIYGKIAGGIVAQSGSSDKFDACTASTNIFGSGFTYSNNDSSTDSTVAGGIIGIAKGTTEFKSCGNQSLIKAHTAGGLIGRIDTGISGGIPGATNYIFGEIIAVNYAGGIIGKGVSTKLSYPINEGFVAVTKLSTSNYAGGIAGELGTTNSSVSNASMKGYVGIWDYWKEKTTEDGTSYGTNYYKTSQLLDDEHGAGSYTASSSNNDTTKEYGKNPTYGEYHYATFVATGVSSGTNNTASLYSEFVLIDYYMKIKQDYHHAWTGTRTVTLSSTWVRSSATTKNCSYGGMTLAYEKEGSGGSSDTEKGYVHFAPDYSKCKITASVSASTTASIPANSDAKSYIVTLQSTTYDTSNNDYPAEYRYFEGQSIQLPTGDLDSTGGRELAGWYTQDNGAGAKITSGTLIDELAGYANASGEITLYAYWDKISITIDLYGKGNQYHDHLASDVDHEFAGLSEEQQQKAETDAAAAKTASFVGTINARYEDTFSSLSTAMSDSSITDNLVLSGYRVAGWFKVSPLKWNELVYNITELGALNNYRKAAEEELKAIAGSDEKDDYEGQTITSAMMGGAITGLPAMYQKTQITNSYKFTDTSSEIFAYWIQTFQVTFYKNNGQAEDVKVIDKGSTVAQPANPTKTGYTFDGWYTDSACTNKFVFTTKITATTNLYAKWVGNDVNVTFNYYDELSSSYKTLKTMTLKNGEQIKASDIPSVTRTGYSFAGWYKGASLHTSNTTFNYTLDEGNNTTLTFTAKYSPETYTVNFYEEAGGTAISTQTVNHNECATAISDPVREGSTFLGWFVSTNGGTTLGTEFTFTTLVTADTEVYAKWETEQLDLTFMVQNDGGTWEEYLIIQSGYGQLVTSLPIDPTKDGEYRFAGWCLSSDLTTVVDFSTYKPTTDVTLYAKFNEQVTITFVDGSNTEIGSVKVDKGTAASKDDLYNALTALGDLDGYFTYDSDTETWSTTLTFENASTNDQVYPLTQTFNEDVTLIVYS